MTRSKNPRFSGMKQDPYANVTKNLKSDTGKGRKIKKRASAGSVTKKKGLSSYQRRTNEEFLKVRDGETKEQWQKRTRWRRVLSEEELAATVEGKRKADRLLAKRNAPKKRYVEIYHTDKNFNFLKYYVFVINWATIKFDICQMDLEIGFHFYDIPYFSHEQFNSKCQMFSNPTVDTFFRFKRQGLIYECTSIIDNGKVKRPVGVFKLSPSFVNVLTKIYEKLSYQDPFDFVVMPKKPITYEMEVIMNEMAQENQDIISRKKEPHRIIFYKASEDGRRKTPDPV